ncbi:ABC transporter ATP-binding protein, partial [Streptomyces zhihengii]
HEQEGRTVRLHTTDPQRTAAGVLAWADRTGLRLDALDVRSASLEEAFLGIAGHDGHGQEVAA